MSPNYGSLYLSGYEERSEKNLINLKKKEK